MIRAKKSDKWLFMQLQLCITFLIFASFLTYTLYTLLSFSLRNTRYSAFYITKSPEQLWEIHSERMQKAQEYMSQLLLQDTSWIDRDKKVDVCVGIASVDRSPHQYLTITLASVLKAITRWEWEKYGIRIIVLDTEADPNRNIEAKSFIGKYPSLFEVIATDYSVPFNSTWYEKEVMDYVQILRLCKATNPQMAIILEDDTMATHHFISKFIKYVDSLPESAEYMDIKLFYPDFYCGFSGFVHIFCLVIWALFSGAFITTVVWKLLLSPMYKVKLILVMTFLYIFAVSLAVPLLIGKQNIMWSWKFGIHPFTATAFTNAVAYHNSKIEFISSILEKKAGEKAVDLLLDYIAVDYKLPRYLIVPNLFQHIGIYSSNIQKNQGNDWHLKTSMSFVEE